MFRRNFLCFSLCPLPLVLSLGTTEKSLAPSSWIVKCVSKWRGVWFDTKMTRSKIHAGLLWWKYYFAWLVRAQPYKIKSPRPNISCRHIRCAVFGTVLLRRIFKNQLSSYKIQKGPTLHSKLCCSSLSISSIHPYQMVLSSFAKISVFLWGKKPLRFRFNGLQLCIYP